MQLDRLYSEQERLAKRAALYDAFGKIRHIAGVDCSYLDDRIIGGAVVLDYETLKPVEHAHAILKLKFPYIPGLLAYREADAMMAACKKIKSDVDILMIDGFGTNHPRRCGIATHIGVKLDMPTMGVGKVSCAARYVMTTISARPARKWASSFTPAARSGRSTCRRAIKYRWTQRSRSSCIARRPAGYRSRPGWPTST